MQNWVSKKVPKNAEPDLVKGSPKVQRWAPKRARQPTMLVLTWTMYFSGPFLCTFYLTNTILIFLAVVACSKIHSIHKKHEYDIGNKERNQY